jgi:hypothetical protein
MMCAALEYFFVVVGALTVAMALIVLRWWLGWHDPLIDAFFKGLRG